MHGIVPLSKRLLPIVRQTPVPHRFSKNPDRQPTVSEIAAGQADGSQLLVKFAAIVLSWSKLEMFTVFVKNLFQ